MSDNKKIAAAFVKACAALQPATKNSKNAHLGNSYADLESVQTAARAALAPHGLAWLQQVIREDGRIGVHTTLIHESGETLDAGRCLITPPPGRNVAHSEGAALSYARRYSLACAVGIHQADPDASLPAAPPARPAAKPKPKAHTLKSLGLTVAKVDQWLEGKGKAGRWSTMDAERKAAALSYFAANPGAVDA